MKYAVYEVLGKKKYIPIQSRIPDQIFYIGEGVCELVFNKGSSSEHRVETTMDKLQITEQIE